MEEAGTRKGAFVWLSFASLAGVATAVVLAWAATESWEAALAVGLALAGTLAVLLRLRLRRELNKLSEMVEVLPLLDGGGRPPTLNDFDRAVGAVQRTAVILQNRLAEAGNSRKELEALLDSMQDAVVAVDAAGRIQWTNQRMQLLLPRSGLGGVRVGHALVQTIRDPEVLECVRIALAQGLVTDRRSTTLLPGRIFSINVSPTPTGGAVAVLQDVTRVEEVERTQRDFVANVSHELRTPLTSISGYVETLIDHESGISAQGREFLETILKNAARMTRLTEDLLVMARVEASTLELHPERVATDQVIEDALRAMRGLVRESGAQLVLGESTGTEVMADPDAVLQVLGNLIENAVKYGRNGEPAQVTVSAREVSEPLDGVEICVADRGPGIASEHLARIFERFYRVDKARSRESGGTGLGLSIVRHMVQSLGGTVRAESTLGAGSRFFVVLPLAGPSSAKPDELGQSGESGL